MKRRTVKLVIVFLIAEAVAITVVLPAVGIPSGDAIGFILLLNLFIVIVSPILRAAIGSLADNRRAGM